MLISKSENSKYCTINQRVKRCTMSKPVLLGDGEGDGVYLHSRTFQVCTCQNAFPEERKEISNEIITEKFLKTKRIATKQSNTGPGLHLKFFLPFQSPTLLLDKVATKRDLNTNVFRKIPSRSLKRQVFSLHLTNMADFPPRRRYDAATNPEKLFSQTGHCELSLKQGRFWGIHIWDKGSFRTEYKHQRP